jgi:hypothetical protein
VSLALIPSALAGRKVATTTDSHGNPALAVYCDCRAVATEAVLAASRKGYRAMVLKPSRREVFEFGASFKVLVTAGQWAIAEAA